MRAKRNMLLIIPHWKLHKTSPVPQHMMTLLPPSPNAFSINTEHDIDCSEFYQKTVKNLGELGVSQFFQSMGFVLWIVSYEVIHK